MIELRGIETFYWVATLGGFRAAADKLHTSQPAISQRIAQLESSLGTRLLDRDTRGVRLTVKGQSLLAHAERMLQMKHDMLLVARAQNAFRGRLCIGVVETIVQTWLPALLERVHLSFPDLVLELEVEPPPCCAPSRSPRAGLPPMASPRRPLIRSTYQPQSEHAIGQPTGLAFQCRPATKRRSQMPTVPDLMESQRIRMRVRSGQMVALTAGLAPGCAQAKVAIRKRAADGETHQVVAPHVDQIGALRHHFAVAPHPVQGKIRAPIDIGAQGAQARAAF